MAPTLTISLVTYNGARWLANCLASIAQQELTDFELLILDNGSTDGSIQLLREFARDEKRAVLVESGRNLGYSAAHNMNIFKSRAQFVLLLNQDVVLDSGFAAAALAAFASHPDVGSVQAKVLHLGASFERTAVIDTTGLAMKRDRRVVARRQGELEAASDQLPGPVWGADGPAAVHRRTALLEASLPRTNGGREILDEDFFMYKEDVDLAWRLRRLGWQTWYEPKALAWHARGAGGGRQRSWLDIARTRWTIPLWIRRASWRNQRLMQLKNEDPTEFVRDLPWIARREILSLLFIVLTDPLRLTAVASLVRMSRATLAKRRALWRIVKKTHSLEAE